MHIIRRLAKRVYAEQNKEPEPPAYFSSSHLGTLLKIIGIFTLLCHIKIYILVRKTKFLWHWYIKFNIVYTFSNFLIQCS